MPISFLILKHEALRIRDNIIDKAKKSKGFSKTSAPHYVFQPAKCVVDTMTFRKWLIYVFLPFGWKRTSENVALIMVNCEPQGIDLLDPTEQITVNTLPRNCNSMFQPMDTEVIAFIKLRYWPRLPSRMLEVF